MKALTHAESAAAELLCEGLTDAEIGHLLGKARGTIKVQLKYARRKLGARNRVDLALKMRARKATA